MTDSSAPRTRLPVSAISCGAMLAGCGGPQSALDPAGTGASDIAQLFWWMAASVAVIWLLVIGVSVAANFARWIGHTETVKPGVRMPGYEMLDADQLQAISHYLMALQ